MQSVQTKYKVFNCFQAPAAKDSDSFATMFRKSGFVSLGDWKDKKVYGTVFKVSFVFIIFCWKNSIYNSFKK